MRDTARGDHPAGEGFPRTNRDMVLRLISLGFSPVPQKSSADMSAWTYSGIDGILLMPTIRSMSDRCSDFSVSRAASHIGLPVGKFWNAPILVEVVIALDDIPLSAEDALDLILPDKSCISHDLLESWLSITDQVLSLASASSNR